MEGLSREEKKLCRCLIEKGLEKSCRKFVERIRKIVAEKICDADHYEEVNGVPVEGPWHKKYIEICKATTKFDKSVALRYNDIGGSRYLDTVRALYWDKLINDDDIAEFTEEHQAYITFTLG